ncbi:MAG: transketolase [Firmicutes bacterium]|nr:transketolase [Bacillota bacterium]
MNKDQLAVNCIRMLAAESVEKAGSGHPGLPMGGAAIGWTLWSQFLRHFPNDSYWPDRDRFVLSAGHGSALLYALLHIFGYDVSIEDLQQFRQWGSKTPGHPEFGHTDGVETTTGPLGQGFANAVGMAIAEQRLAAEFNRPGFELINHHTYVYMGDGCMMEGITAEAASLAGHLQLGKLIALYDDNQITIDGSTDLSFSEDVGGRYRACGWQVLTVCSGNDTVALAEALHAARANLNQPSLIIVRTQIGYGSPGKQGSAAAHGAPLGAEELARTREYLAWEYPPFTVPEPVTELVEARKQNLTRQYKEWLKLLSRYFDKFPEEAARWRRWHQGDVPAQLATDLASLVFDAPEATRASSARALAVAAEHMPNLCGGSADLNVSTLTYLDGKGDFTATNRRGNNIFFGIREHAMAAICNGLSLHGGLRAFCATFLTFADYLKPALRLSALMRQPVIYVFTHDSIGVGEDGPTHQPVEQLAMLRSIPNLHVLRPADGRETALAWQLAAERRDGPTALILSRQKLPPLVGTGPAVARGAYVLGERPQQADILLLASGSELQLAVAARDRLATEGIVAQVVSMVCQELFALQEDSYRQQVLPPDVPRLGIEAAHPMAWGQLLGPGDICMGLEEFGASAPGPEVMERLGFTTDNIVALAKELVKQIG